MEHSLHLAAGHVLSHILPAETGKIHGAGAGNGNRDGESSEDASSDDSGAIISGALRKLMSLIKQVGRIRCNYHMF